MAACLGVAVDIIEPCGFPLTDKALKRAALDYAELVEIKRHDAWANFMESHRRTGGRLVLFTTAAESDLAGARFESNDMLLFGRESAGVPAEVHNAANVRLRIPIARETRSLNVAMAAGIALWEALRQTGGLPRS